jgi:hypothetical protein
MIKWKNYGNEKNIPAFENPPHPDARIPRPHGDERGPRRIAAQAQSRTQARRGFGEKIIDINA